MRADLERRGRAAAAARGRRPAWPGAQEGARSELPLRPQPHRPDRPRCGAARWRDRGRGRPRSRRADAGAAGRRGGAGRGHRARSARPAGARRDRGALSGPAGGGRCGRAGLRSAAADRRPGRRASWPTCPTTSARRCSPAGSTARRGRPGGIRRVADVPARGRRAHRRRTRAAGRLRPARRAVRLAHTGRHPVRRQPVGLRAAAEGDVERGPDRAPGPAPALPGAGSGSRDPRGLRPAPQDAAPEPEGP